MLEIKSLYMGIIMIDNSHQLPYDCDPVTGNQYNKNIHLFLHYYWCFLINSLFVIIGCFGIFLIIQKVISW